MLTDSSSRVMHSSILLLWCYSLSTYVQCPGLPMLRAFYSCAFHCLPLMSYSTATCYMSLLDNAFTCLLSVHVFALYCQCLPTCFTTLFWALRRHHQCPHLLHLTNALRDARYCLPLSTGAWLCLYLWYKFCSHNSNGKNSICYRANKFDSEIFEQK